MFKLKTLMVCLTLTTFAMAQFVSPAPESINRNRYQVMVQGAPNMQGMRSYLEWLKSNDFDIAGVKWNEAKIEIITDDEGINKLTQYRIPHQVMARKSPGRDMTPMIDNRYLNPEKVEQKLKQLNAQFPNDTKLEKIGVSNQGRPIWALLISKDISKNDGSFYTRPTLIVDGMHHAREIMTSEIVVDAADAILNTKRIISPWNQLLDSWNIWLVPMMNVDGNNIVWTSDNWWRKNGRADGSKVFGVDLNRNYAYMWSGCNGSSGSKSSETYRGDKAASEPETQAIMKLGYQAQPTAYLSYHSYSELILYPYGCQGALTAEDRLHATTAQELSKLLPTDNSRGFYTPGTPWNILYSVDGDSMGFMHAEFGALSYTFEVNQSFQPPYELREPTVQKHRKAWSYLIQKMTQNMLSLKVVSQQRFQPLAATISISGIIKTKGEKPFVTNAGGNFFKVMEPGLYNVKIQLADGRAQEVKVNMSGQPVSQVISF